MAVVGTNLTSDADGVDRTSYTTAAITATADALVLAAVTGQDDGNQDPSTVSIGAGGGLTWVVVATRTFETAGFNRQRITVLRAMASSPSSHALVIDVSNGTGNQTGCLWSVDEFTGVDTGGTNGSAAVVQSASNFNNSNTAAGDGGVLAAFGDAVNNAAYGAIATRGNNLNIVDEVGYTELAQVATGSDPQNLQTTYKVGEDTTVSWTFPSDEYGAISIEIKASAAAGISIPVVQHHRQRNF